MLREDALETIAKTLAERAQVAMEHAGRTVINQTGVNGIIDEVRRYPEIIAQNQAILQAAQTTLTEAKGELELAKATIMAEIRDEVNGNGKPAYSNQEARDAEFVRRARVDDQYQADLARYLAAEERVALTRITVDRSINEFAAVRGVLTAQTAKVNLLAGML